jgi:alpha-mannosidase
VNPQTPRRLREAISAPLREQDRLLRRARVQIQFAEAFGALLEANGKAPTDWKSLINDAKQRIDQISADELEKAVGEIESLLAPLGAIAKQYVIHCVGHGHIDMNWMWSWPETVAATHDTFASVLQIMREAPDVTYSQSQTAVYALTQKYRPAQFEEIKQRIEEGRWEVTAAQWVEGDKNLSGGSSLCRHYLYAREFAETQLDLKPEQLVVQWEPDTFGHANTIPMIAAHGGVKYYYACRTGGGFESPRVGDERPPLFRWEAPGGQSILVNRETSWYNSYVNIGENIALAAVGFWSEAGGHDWLNVYGIGNHGGGPTRDEIAYYRELQTFPIYPRVEFSTSLQYFDAVAGLEVPTVDHELNFEFLGCYTSQSLIKEANRLGEHFCLEVEALDMMAGTNHQTARREAWINVLFNQFHDILPGSGVRETREHARGIFQETTAITASIKRSAMEKIASEVNSAALLPDVPEAKEDQSGAPFTAGAGLGARLHGVSRASGGGKRFFPFVIFNPLGWDRTNVVTLHVWDSDLDPSKVVVIDDQGRVQTAFLVERAREWDHSRLTFLVYAEDVPAFGHRTLMLCEDWGVERNDQGVEVTDTLSVRSEFLSATFNRYGIGFDEISDRRSDVDYVTGGPFGDWRFETERPFIMTSWVLGGSVGDIESFRVNRFDLYGEQRNVATLAATGKSPFILGTHRAESASSKVTVRSLFHSRLPRIDFEAELDWREIGTPERGIPGIRVTFFNELQRLGRMKFESPFGSVERLAERDVPTLRYAHLASDEGPSMTILTSTKSAFFEHAGGLEMRVIRSSFDPDPLPEVNQQTVRYAAVFHEKPPTDADLARLGMEFNSPLLVCPAGVHEGSRATSGGSSTFVGDGIVVVSAKPAEDGNGVIYHLVNYSESASEASFTGSGTAHEVDSREASLRAVNFPLTLAPQSLIAVRVS